MMRLFYYRKNITNTALKIDIISADIDWHLLSITLTLQGLAWSVYDQCFALLYAGNRKSSSDPQKLMEPISNTNFLQYLIWFNWISSMYTNHLKKGTCIPVVNSLMANSLKWVVWDWKNMAAFFHKQPTFAPLLFMGYKCGRSADTA